MQRGVEDKTVKIDLAMWELFNASLYLPKWKFPVSLMHNQKVNTQHIGKAAAGFYHKTVCWQIFWGRFAC